MSPTRCAGVTPQRVADMLLAAGASPAMIDNPDEIGQFAGLADLIGGGVYLNTGLHSSQINALPAVVDWRKSSADSVLVVDPVGYGATAWRSAAIESMLAECRPDTIKGNASEIVGLSGAQVCQRQEQPVLECNSAYRVLSNTISAWACARTG